MLDPRYRCAEHEVAKWCLLSTITFFIWLACWSAEKEVWIWRTTDVKSLKLTMSVSAITISNIRKLPWRKQTLDKKEEQTKGKDWCKESSKPGQRGWKPGQRGRQSEGGWGEGATPGHEEEEWSLQGQLVSSIIIIHVVRILWNQSKVCLHRHLIAEAALCTIPLPGKSLIDNRESFAPTGIHAFIQKQGLRLYDKQQKNSVTNWFPQYYCSNEQLMLACWLLTGTQLTQLNNCAN